MSHIPLPLQLYVPLLLAGLGFMLLMAAAVWTAHFGSRAAQGLRLRGLRMRDMLDMRNIDRRAYLKLTPLRQLRRQLSDCAHCSNKRQCDAQIVAGEIYGIGFAYCPNTPALNALQELIRKNAAGSR